MFGVENRTRREGRGVARDARQAKRDERFVRERAKGARTNAGRLRDLYIEDLLDAADAAKMTICEHQKTIETNGKEMDLIRDDRGERERSANEQRQEAAACKASFGTHANGIEYSRRGNRTFTL